MQFVNPLTAICLLHRARTELKSAAVIQTGAASQLGRMMIYLAKQDKVPLINIVRREEQVTLLKEQYGCQHVLNSSSENFFEEFKDLAKKLKATCLIECVSGNLTG